MRIPTQMFPLLLIRAIDSKLKTKERTEVQGTGVCLYVFWGKMSGRFICR